MTNRERRALSQDFPKDFLSESEWDFIESMATCKGDGVRNRSKQSNTACHMPKSGGGNIMAQTNNSFSDLDKIKHYSARVSDQSLSQGQRDYAARRLSALTGNDKSTQASGNRQGNGSRRPSNNQQSNNTRGVSGGKPNVLNVYVHTVK